MISKYLIASGLAVGTIVWGWSSMTATSPAPLEPHPPQTQPETQPATQSASQPESAEAALANGAREAVRRSLAVLQADGVAWLEGRTQVQSGDGCVSCHQVPFGVWGLQEAMRVGVVEDPSAVADLTRRAIDFATEPRKARSMSWGPLILATEADVSRESEFVDFILDNQTKDGYWRARGQFPRQRRDLDETNAVATMWTILTLAPLAQPPPAPVTDPRVVQSVASASTWVDEMGDGDSTEWLLLRSKTLEVTGETERAAKLREELLLQQNVDGGWSWIPGEESNALTTGQVLYGLQLNQGSEAAPESGAIVRAIARAIEYLAASQGDDGLWLVSSALTSQEQSADRDYIYDYWGTAWATIGLSKSLG